MLLVVLAAGGGGFAMPARASEAFLALPVQARPSADAASAYRVQKVGDSGFVVMSGIYQAVFVVTSAGVVLIDAPPAMAAILPAAIRSVTDKRVTHVILSHDHFDHIGAVNLFPSAKLVAHELTAQMLAVLPDPARPVPAFTFSGAHYELTVGDEVFELLYPAPSHEAGDILVFVPRDKLAVMTDFVVPGWAPYWGWGNADYLPGYFKVYDALLRLDFDTYVGGHLYRTGTRRDVEESRAYLIDLWIWTKAEMAASPMKPAADPANVWAAQTAWFDQVADRVTARLIAKWQGRLAAVDTFTHDSVIAAIISITTDNPNIPAALLQ